MLSLTRWSLVAVTWLGAMFRIRALFANRFHADEALFAGWARQIAVWRDPLLLNQPVDKPPLLFYLQALFYPLFGPVELAARLPNLIASLLLIPLTGMLAWRLYRDETATVVAAVVIAVAPLAIQFSATAFSDPLLTLWLTAALFFAARPRLPDEERQECVQPFLAGLMFGLALATKYQALLFLPVAIGLILLSRWCRRDSLRGLGGLTLALVPFLLWLIARSESTALVARQWANIGGLRPAWSWELWPRSIAQGQLWQVSLGWPLLIGVGILGAILLFFNRCRFARFDPVTWVLALFCLAYLVLHWLWAIPVWDRYLLPLMPLVSILIGRLVSRSLLFAGSLGDRTGRGRVPASVMIIFLVLVFAIQLPVAAGARLGRYPIGGRPDADGGAAEIASLLFDAPYGTVLYDHWYSWHWRYQLFDRRVYVSWFPHDEALVEDLNVFAGNSSPRYIVLPSDDTSRPVVRRLEESGYVLTSVSDLPQTSMTLYRIDPEQKP